MKKGLICLLSVLIFNFFFVAAISYPQAIQGNIIIKDGGSAHGLDIIAKVGGVATATCKINTNTYGIQSNCVVIDYIGSGDIIKFYLGEEEAEESIDFSRFEAAFLNLTFNNLPEGFSSCGNGVCDFGECSNCAIDCKISECYDNGVCDSKIGESCQNAPKDCGTCEFCGDSICNNGESCSTCTSDCGPCDENTGDGNAGGGGGGSSTISTSNINNSIPDNMGVSAGIDSIEVLNFEEELKNEENTHSRRGITGAVIGNLSSPVDYGIFIGVFLIITLIALFIIFKKRKKLD